MANKFKGKKRGGRVNVEWGKAKVLEGGKKVEKTVYSKVLADTAKKFGLKEATKLPKPAVKTDKKKRKYLAKAAKISASTGHYLLASDGEKSKNKKTPNAIVFYRIPVHPAISLAAAAAVLIKAGKVKGVRYPGGEVFDLK